MHTEQLIATTCTAEDVKVRTISAKATADLDSILGWVSHYRDTPNLALPYAPDVAALTRLGALVARVQDGISTAEVAVCGWEGDVVADWTNRDGGVQQTWTCPSCDTHHEEWIARHELDD